MQLTLHETRRTTSRRFAPGASNACLVGETRPAPFWHYSDASVYGYTTTAIHDMSTLPLLTIRLETARFCFSPLPAPQPNREDSPLTRKIRMLENRLDKAMIKYNEAQSIRKTYEQIVKRLKVGEGLSACPFTCGDSEFSCIAFQGQGRCIRSARETTVRGLAK